MRLSRSGASRLFVIVQVSGNVPRASTRLADLAIMSSSLVRITRIFDAPEYRLRLKPVEEKGYRYKVICLGKGARRLQLSRWAGDNPRDPGQSDTIDLPADT